MQAKPPLVPFLALLALATACGRPQPAARPAARPQPAAAGHSVASKPAVYQAEVEEGLGAAVMIVVDASGSMAQPAAGDGRPKYLVAREAIARMLEVTAAFQQRRPDFPVHVGVMHFSSGAWCDLPPRPYDPAAVSSALAKIPAPGGGTAIGDALLAARRQLYGAGVYQKHLLVVTDGENTAGRKPDEVACEIHARSEGAVRLHFVAFDTSPAKFGFLQPLGGSVTAAANGSELSAALQRIYEGEILAEADYGEGRSQDGRQQTGGRR